MSLTSLNIASRGHLDRGDDTTLNIAVRGFLRGVVVVPPIPDQGRPGGSGSKKRAQSRIKHIRDIVAASRKKLDDERLRELKAEALAIAEAEGLKTTPIRDAVGINAVLSAVRGLTKQLNSEVAQEERFRKTHEQAMQAERTKQAKARSERLGTFLKAEQDRQRAEREENEMIAIALLIA